MSFQLDPFDPLQAEKEAARMEAGERKEEQARCEQARREWEGRSSLASVLLWLFAGTIALALLKFVLKFLFGW